MKTLSTLLLFIVLSCIPLISNPYQFSDSPLLRYVLKKNFKKRLYQKCKLALDNKEYDKLLHLIETHKCLFSRDPKIFDSTMYLDKNTIYPEHDPMEKEIMHTALTLILKMAHCIPNDFLQLEKELKKDQKEDSLDTFFSTLNQYSRLKLQVQQPPLFSDHIYPYVKSMYTLLPLINESILGSWEHYGHMNENLKNEDLKRIITLEKSNLNSISTSYTTKRHIIILDTETSYYPSICTEEHLKLLTLASYNTGKLLNTLSNFDKFSFCTFASQDSGSSISPSYLNLAKKTIRSFKNNISMYMHFLYPSPPPKQDDTLLLDPLTLPIDFLSNFNPQIIDSINAILSNNLE